MRLIPSGTPLRRHAQPSPQEDVVTTLEHLGSRLPDPVLTRVVRALDELRRGRPVLVVDDEDREDEGDLVVAAELVDDATMAFVLRHTSGIVCVGLPGERLDALRLPQMVVQGDDPRGTAFTVSVDLKAGTTTGISAADRTLTVRALADPATDPAELSRPGHVFPLQARAGGVLERRGHTEAAVDLCRLAGLQPAGVLSEVMNDDGTVARGASLRAFAQEHGLALLSVGDLARYRRRTELRVQAQGTAQVPTAHGPFLATCYVSLDDATEHLALVAGDVSGAQDVLVRVHSECLTGDALGSRLCDCGEQLDAGLAAIAAEGRGVLVYLRGHEGRGIGLAHKLQAYALQSRGLDTVDANLALGLPVDAREYHVAADVLRELGVASVRLMTNNPAKCRGLTDFGVRVSAQVPLVVPPRPSNVGYLRTKRDRMEHRLDDLAPVASDA